VKTTLSRFGKKKNERGLFFIFSELQLIELQNEEHRLQKQVDVIKKALFEIGCEELPSGCDLPSLDINDIDITVSDYKIVLFSNRLVDFPKSPLC